MDIRLYDVNSRLNQHPSHHTNMRGCDVIEFHLNSGGGTGTELLIKKGYSPDKMDNAILNASTKTFKNRGIKYRNDLYNMNRFASLGIPYRLLECCFIDNQNDLKQYDTNFEMLCTNIANAIKANYTKPVVLVHGHGEVDPGACANGRKEAVETIRICKRIYELLTNPSQDAFKYRVHMQNLGWGNWTNGVAGTTGKSLRIEALQINPVNLNITAKVHMADIGWKDYGFITKDTIVGTVGEARQLEDICLCCTNATMEYRVHIQGIGWTAWTKADGIATLGTVGQALQLEAIEIRIK